MNILNLKNNMNFSEACAATSGWIFFSLPDNIQLKDLGVREWFSNQFENYWNP